MFEIVHDILDIRTLAQQVASESDGAIVTFSGSFAGRTRGRRFFFSSMKPIRKWP